MDISPLELCLKDLRARDHDRYLTLPFVPEEVRATVTVLYAFNAEIARIRETVSEPMLGEIRLQWWREGIEALGDGELRQHPVLEAMAATKESGIWEADTVMPLIDARARDLDEDPIETLEALEDYAEATSSELMRLALKACGATAPVDLVRHAGLAYALTGLLRAMPTHASQGRILIPLETMRETGLDPHSVLRGQTNDGLREAYDAMIARIDMHLDVLRTRRREIAREAVPALMPVSLVPLYLRQLRDPAYHPFEDPTDVPAYRRQWRLLRSRRALKV